MTSSSKYIKFTIKLINSSSKYMNEVNGYKEDHSYTNWRIFWILLINLVAGAALLLQYFRGFQEAKLALAGASAFFIIFHNAYCFYWAYIGQPAFYRGELAGGKGQAVWLDSKLALPKAEYEVKVIHPDGKGGFKQVNEFKTCIGNWITEDGFVDVPAAVKDLQSLRMTSR